MNGSFQSFTVKVGNAGFILAFLNAIHDNVSYKE